MKVQPINTNDVYSIDTRDVYARKTVHKKVPVRIMYRGDSLELLPPRNDGELWQVVKMLTGIEIPRRQVCANHVAPFTAFSASYFARYPFIIWKASRGFGGKSLLLALLGYIENVFLGAEVNLLGGSGEQSKRVHEHQQGFWRFSRAPYTLLISDPTQTHTECLNGGTATCLKASQASVRGPHPQRLRLDEIDEMDLDIFNAAMGQPMSAHGITQQVTASSTQQHPDGTMVEAMKRAAEYGNPTFEWCYRETLEPHGWLQQSEVDLKRTQVDNNTWQAEYEGQEPVVEGRAFLPNNIETMFDIELGDYIGQDGEEIEVEPPVAKAWYAHGADWAKDRDWTVIVTLRVDTTPATVVAFQRLGRMEWPQMIDVLDRRVAKYGGAGYADATGIGNVVQDFLSPESKRKIKPFLMVGRERDQMLTQYIADVEHDAIKSPRIQYAYTEHKYARRVDMYGGQSVAHHLPDTVCAFALAWHARNNARPETFVIPFGMDNTSSWE